MIVADTSGLLAFFNVREPAHSAVVATVERHGGPMVISPFVVAELDYLVATRLGIDAELLVLDELSSGAYDLAAFDAGDLRTCGEIVDRYRDQRIGVTDASIVVLADRYATDLILTLDRRHFDVLRPLRGDHFTVLGG